MRAGIFQFGCSIFLSLAFVGGFNLCLAGQKIKLPRTIKQGLKRHYKNWRLVTNKTEEGKICPSILTGDFDGNGETDYAIYLHTSNSPLAKQQRFILYLKQGTKYYRRTLSQEPAEQMTCPFFYKKGERDYRYDTGKYFRYRYDTVGLAMGMGGHSYIYEKKRFNQVITID